MKSHQFPLFFLMVLSIGNLRAQTNTFDFTLNSESVSFIGQTIVVNSVIQKTGTTITWTQTKNDVNDILTFTLNDISGSWDTNSGGTLTYTMIFEGVESTLNLSGEESGISASIIFNSGSSEEDIYYFNLNEITYQ